MFPKSFNKRSINELQQNNRHNRCTAKQKKLNSESSFTIELNNTNLPSNNYLLTNKHDIETQVAFDVSDVECF
jgi:hypothetical protein